MNITCRKTDCKYNHNFVCAVENLNVGGHSLCNSYERCEDKECHRVDLKNVSAEKKIEDSSKKMFKKAPKYDPYRSAKHCNICCQAKCMFNDKKRCHANGITVNDLEESPYCMTFLEKGEGQ